METRDVQFPTPDANGVDSYGLVLRKLTWGFMPEMPRNLLISNFSDVFMTGLRACLPLRKHRFFFFIHRARVNRWQLLTDNFDSRSCHSARKSFVNRCRLLPALRVPPRGKHRLPPQTVQACAT